MDAVAAQPRNTKARRKHTDRPSVFSQTSLTLKIHLPAPHVAEDLLLNTFNRTKEADMSIQVPAAPANEAVHVCNSRSTECTLPPVVGRPLQRYDVNGKGVRLTGKELQVLELL